MYRIYPHRLRWRSWCTRRAAGVAAFLCCTVRLALPAPVSTAAATTQYEFVNIADSGGPFLRDSFGFPSINNRGVVSFGAGLDDGGSGLFAADSRGGRITTLVDSRSGGLVRFVSNEPHGLNDAGTVAFQGGLGDGRTGVFTVGPGRPLTTVFTGFHELGGVAENPPVQSYPILGYRTDVDGAGAAVFWMRDASGVTSILRGSGGPLATVADTRGELRFLGEPSVNQPGTVTFIGARAGQDLGVYIADVGGIRRLASASEVGGLLAYGIPAINDLGTVAVRGDAGIIIVAPDGTVATAADEGRPLFPAFNDAGAVAFQGSFGDYPNNVYGIFTGSDPVADKVVSNEDLLFGAHPYKMFVFDGGINDRGEIAFGYSLPDGRSGIAVARPAPEPAGVALLAVAAVVATRRVRVRQS